MPNRPWLVVAALLAPVWFVAAQEGQAPPPPQGVEVMARGPIHEAFASLTSEPAPSRPVPKKPPKPIEELPPAEKPEGAVVWIGGYWAWDDERSDYLWVSGVWRQPPPGKQWVAGYWREDSDRWQWVPGFWTAEARAEEQKITYLPEPPKAPQMAPPGKPPGEESFYVPGTWMWTGDRYAWRAGYWARMQPGYVWVPDHYRWTPTGYVFIPGYWDLALKNRGILYAPVVISPSVVTVGFTYTPAYAVRDTVIVDALFVRPSHCHYYFGDYYGATYTSLGYESCVVYSRRSYDSIIVYESYERRRDPTWISLQINLYNDRCRGVAPLPPRTLVQQNTIVNNTTIVNNNATVVNNNITMIAPSAQVAQTKNVKLEKLDTSTRQQARQQAVALQQVGQQRSSSELATPAGAPRQPRVASLAMPKAQSVAAAATAPGRSTALTGRNSPVTRSTLPRTTAPAATTGLGGTAGVAGRTTSAATLGQPNAAAATRSSIQPVGQWTPGQAASAAGGTAPTSYRPGQAGNAPSYAPRTARPTQPPPRKPAPNRPANKKESNRPQ